MDSHAYARKIKEAADYILSRPTFETTGNEASIYLGYYFDKSIFIDAAKALGTVDKVYNETDLKIQTVKGAKIWATINRNTVCRKVQEAKWECEPLLTPEEEDSL